MQGSACVEVMTTLHGSVPSLWRRVEGCVPPRTAQVLPPGTSHGIPFYLSDHCEIAPPPAATVLPPIFTTIDDMIALTEQEARVERLEARMRQIRLQDRGLTWDDRDGIPAASLPAKFRMPDIERYSGIGCLKIHLRLYSTVMRAHGIDDAQLVALFPMSLSRVAQRWFASVEPSRLRTWEDVAHEFLTQFAFSVEIDVSRRELEATRQRLNESISSFVNRWRAKVVGMIDRPKEQDQIDMVLRNLQLRFARHLVGILFQDLKSMVHATFSVEEAIARGLWTDIAASPDSKGKKSIGSPSRSREYQLFYVQEPYIAQTSMQPRPPHPRATTHPAFEKLRDASLIVPLAPRPLPHPIPLYFHSHEHCLYHQIQIGLIWMLMILRVIWYFGIFRVEDLWLDCLMILLRQRGSHGASRFEPLHITSESQSD
ncbi:hypothetical protein AAG906_038752 [Vitis piasezkii]